MHAWLARVASSRYANELVLRGSLVTACYCPTRLAFDVDHLAVSDSVFDEARFRERIAEIARPLVIRSEVIWAETAFPGLRSWVRFGETELQIDVGFGDPLVLSPAPITIGDAPLLAVRPETMFAWKVHGLFEFGRGNWRPKDLLDLFLYLEHVPLDDDAVLASIRVAFESRRTPLELAVPFFGEDWGQSRGSQRKWRWLRRQEITRDPIPDLEVVLTKVKARLLPLLRRLGL
jgi:hypothetical protein